MSDKSADKQEEAKDPFALLGISPDSSFDEIQQARDKKLLEAGDDVILKAKIESSYDSLLMESLKARQLGKISNEAVKASNQEKNIGEKNISKFGSALLTKLSGNNQGSSPDDNSYSASFLNLPEGEGLTTRITIGILVILLFLISPDQSINFIISISTIGAVVSQVKRGRRVFQSLGWSVVFLASGFIIGGIVVNGLVGVNDEALMLSLEKIEALPALLLLWIASLFLA